MGEGTVYCMGWSFVCSPHSVICRHHSSDEHFNIIPRAELTFAAYYIQTQGEQQNWYHNMFTAAQSFSMQSTLGSCHWFDSSCPVYLNFLILQSSVCYQEDKYFLSVMTRQTLGKQTRVMSNYCKMPMQGRPLPCCQAPHSACTLLVCPQTTSGNKLQGADFFLEGKSTAWKQEIRKRKGND